MANAEQRFITDWGREWDPSFVQGRQVSSLAKEFWSHRAKALLYSNQGVGNYLSGRAALGILGGSFSKVAVDGKTALEPTEFADFGAMALFIGPPQSALDAMRAKVSAQNVGPYPPDLIKELRDKAAEIKFLRERSDQFEVIGVEGA